ncbi:hypothetical protein WJX77_010097 [Trebouxia sp. C0004]
MTNKSKAESNTAGQDGAASHSDATAAAADAQEALELFANEPFTFALKPIVRRVLLGIASESASVKQPDDKAFFRELEAVYLLRLLLISCASSLETCAYELQDSSAVLTARLQNGASEPVTVSKKESKAKSAAQIGADDVSTYEGECWAFSSRYIKPTQTALQLALDAIETRHQQRKAAGQNSKGTAPRFERLMDRLDLTDKERLAMLYVLVKQVSQEDFSNLFPKFGRSPPSFAAFAGLDTLEILQFLSPKRQHIKEGLLPDCSKALLGGGQAFDEMAFSIPSKALNDNSLHFSSEVIKALIGEPLSEEELLKVDNTQLMDVLKEEPSFSHDHFSEVKAATTAQAQPPALSNASGLGADEDVFDLIKQEVQRDVQGRKRRAAGDSDEDPASKRDKLATANEAIASASAVLAATDPSISPDTAAPSGDASARRESADGAVSMETEQEERDAERRQSNAAAASRTGDTPKEAEGSMREYRNDLEYLEDSFKLMIITLRIGKFRRILALEDADQEGFEDEGLYYHQRKRGDPKSRAQQQLRELEGKERLEKSRVERRLKLTQAAGQDGEAWKPRLQRLAEARQLAPFEKLVLEVLVGCHVSPSVQRTFLANKPGTGMDEMTAMSPLTVGSLLLAFLPTSLQEQISSRRYFYKSGRLIKDGIITLSNTDFSRDIMDQGVDIDRRMLDFLCGLDTEFSDMVDGSHLYFPSAVQLEDVILPQDQKKLIVETVENFAAYKKVRKSLGLDKSVGGSGGLVLLFHGASGVGKTMMANAVAKHVHRKVLLINFPSLGSNEAGQAIRFIFREAKIHDALLFFDECEAIFEDREKHGSNHVNMLLTEVEKHEGIIIMATNRPHDLDEAMHRRITMTFEFRRPDHTQRQQIWRRQLPDKIQRTDDVDINLLALKYELSGGYIRNAIQAALSRATARDGEAPVVSQADLLHGAQLQLRGALRMKDFDRRRIPTRGLEAVLLPKELKANLDKIVHHEKARAVLMGQWGFGKNGDLAGTVCLFTGEPGTGKTLAAEAVGFETGKPLKIVNCAGLVSKWVGDTPKNIDALFQEARATDAVLCFDEAEGLFGTRSSDMGSSTDRYAAMDVGVLLHHLETHIGIVVLITNKPDAIDSAFQRRIRFSMTFPMPDAPLRAKLWRASVPEQAPVASDVDWESLGKGYQLAGGSIKQAVVRAATQAALRIEDGAAMIKMEDLKAEAQEEIKKGEGSARPAGMYI